MIREVLKDELEKSKIINDHLLNLLKSATQSLD